MSEIGKIKKNSILGRVKSLMKKSEDDDKRSSFVNTNNGNK
ncbi:4102_t:CDS:1, partial [Entrophospora sp. SA101]